MYVLANQRSNFSLFCRSKQSASSTLKTVQTGPLPWQALPLPAMSTPLPGNIDSERSGA
jgi:hypothetical protein